MSLRIDYMCMVQQAQSEITLNLATVLDQPVSGKSGFR